MCLSDGYVVLNNFTLRLGAIVRVDFNESIVIEYVSGTTSRTTTIPVVSEHERFAIHRQLMMALHAETITLGTCTLRRSAIIFVDTRPRAGFKNALSVGYCVGTKSRELIVGAPNMTVINALRRAIVGEDDLFCRVLSRTEIRRDAIALVEIGGTHSRPSLTVIHAFGNEAHFVTVATTSRQLHERCLYSLIGAMYKQDDDIVTIGTTTMHRSSIVSVTLSDESTLIMEYAIGALACETFSLNMQSRALRDKIYCSLVFPTTHNDDDDDDNDEKSRTISPSLLIKRQKTEHTSV